MQTKLKEIQEILSSFDLKKYCIEKDYKIGFYYEEQLHAVNGIIPKTKDNFNEYIFLNYDNLIENNTIYATEFLKEIIARNSIINPNYLLALDYPINYLDFNYLAYEYQLLFKAVKEKNNYEKLNYLRMVINIRNLRSEIVDKKFINELNKIETITGLQYFAMFNELNLIKKINRNSFLKELVDKQVEFHFTKLNKYSGLLILVILNDLGFNIKNFYSSKVSIIDFLEKNIKYIKEPISFISDNSLIKNIDLYESEIQEVFKMFFIKDPVKQKVNYKLISFDTSTVVKEKQNIYHQNFILVEDLDTNEMKMIYGPLVTKIKEFTEDNITGIYL